MAEQVPVGITDHLPAAIAHAEAAIAPCGIKAAVVLLSDLWAVFPMPTSDKADRIWSETISQYPADLVKSAIAQLIATRTWDRDAPVPGHVVSILKADHAERVLYLQRLRSMESRARIDAKAKKPTGPLMRDQPQEDRQAFLAKMREKYPDGFGRIEDMGAA